MGRPRLRIGGAVVNVWLWSYLGALVATYVVAFVLCMWLLLGMLELDKKKKKR